MNFRLLVGFAIAAASFGLSLHHLNQEARNFFDWVALFVVLGGTGAVTAITLQPSERKEAATGLLRLFRGGQPKSAGPLLRDCLLFFDEQEFTSPKGSLPHTVLNSGREMIALGLSSERIYSILRERIENQYEVRKKAAQGIRSLAKYPPAFGLMGTVLGLVELMRALAQGLDPKETGLKMAVALVATMYGLVLANLIINPLGESILKEAQTERQLSVIALRAVMLSCEQATRVETIELLNAFAAEGETLSHGTGEAAA